MEPIAGAWRADEPTLDFTRLTAPQGRAVATRADARARDGRVRPDAVASEAAAWNPFAGTGAAAVADAQTMAAALFTMPVVHADAAARVEAAAPVAATALSSASLSVDDPAVAPPSAEAVTTATHETGHPVVTEATPVAPAPVAPDPVEVAVLAAHAAPIVAPTVELKALAAAPATSVADTAPLTVTEAVSGQPYTSSVTTYAADGSVVSVDLYGFARTFDHVRLDYRADGSLATRTLLDTENPGASIVIDYDESGTRTARHEIGLPDRSYARLDIVYTAEGWAETRTRSGFASGDIASITVRYDAPGEIARVEHLHLDGTRLIVGTAGDDTLAGHGGDTLAGRGGADTFVLLDAHAPALVVTHFDRAEGDRVDLSQLFDGSGHFLGAGGFDGAADAVRFDRVDGGALVSVDLDGDRHADASVLLGGVHGVQVGDFVF